MAASTIFFNGLLISRPGSYSVVDARGLEAIGLGASGIVALIGTAEGGRPVSDMSGPEPIRSLTILIVSPMISFGSLDRGKNANTFEAVIYTKQCQSPSLQLTTLRFKQVPKR